MVDYKEYMEVLDALGKALEPLESVLGTTGNPTKGANKGVTKITANSSDGKVSFGVEYSDVTADTNKYAFSIAATGKAAVGGGGIKEIKYNETTKQYDIRYVDKDGKEQVARLDAKPGDKGTDGTDNSGTEFYASGFCKKKASITGVSGSATGFNASITGMSVGATIYSATVDVISVGITGLYNCATVFGSDSEVVKTKTEAARNTLNISKIRGALIADKKAVLNNTKQSLDDGTVALRVNMPGLKAALSGGSERVSLNRSVSEVQS